MVYTKVIPTQILNPRFSRNSSSIVMRRITSFFVTAHAILNFHGFHTISELECVTFTITHRDQKSFQFISFKDPLPRFLSQLGLVMPLKVIRVYIYQKTGKRSLENFFFKLSLPENVFYCLRRKFVNCASLKGVFKIFRSIR